MSNKFLKQFRGMLFVAVLMICMMSATTLTAFARYREIIPANSGNSLNMSVSDSGTLTWDDVSGATGYRVVLTQPNITELYHWDVTDPYLSLVTEMDGYKCDSGQYIVSVAAKGVIGVDDTMYYYYTSHVDKLESPKNLVWIGDKAAWDAVEGAASYNLSLYDLNGRVLTIPTTSCLYDFSGNSPQDGWTFRVQALSNGTLYSERYSNYVESPARGSRTRTITRVDSGNSLNMSVSDSGTLTWNDVPGATGYRVVLTQPNITELYHWDVSDSYLNLSTEMDGYKCDSGQYIVAVKAKGVIGVDATMYYYYTSHVDKLESPKNLLWIGDKAAWDAVEGATSYNLSLYDFNGHVVTIPTTETLYDFSGSSPQGGWTFRVQALSNGTWSAKRYSNYTESPAKEKLLPTTFYDVGAYVYDDTHKTFDSGGQVSLTTDFGTDGWSDSGYIKLATEGTTVTLNAEPAPGYVFVEWRQGTAGSTISTDAYYQFTVSEHKYLYAIFEEGGTGSSANKPVVCSSFAEFKAAMEDEDIRYVTLKNVNETIPIGKTGLVTAIHVNGIKNLSLQGDATFTAPVSDVTTYAALLHTTNYTTLNISGTGSLTFRAVASNSYNAVIYNQGGSVNISNGTLIGSYNVAVYGKAIWQDSGELRISGGQFFAENALADTGLPKGEAAVKILGGQAWIQDGTFKLENVVQTVDPPYGLEICENATVDLSGGIFHGIILPTSSTPLANYMDEGFYSALSNESWFNPASEYSQEYTASGKVVRIAWLIDHVDVNINEPVAGADIVENYFDIPTSGCQMSLYYPQWYKNGEQIPFGKFEAGASYKVVVQVEVKADYGAEFTKNVTAAINNKPVDVDFKSVQFIEIEYDFGKCPDVIDCVELNVTAPKEGNMISYTVTGNSDGYMAVGSGSQITNYRRWMESADGVSGWREMAAGETFRANYYYKFYTEVRTQNGYRFPLYYDGYSVVPNVSATVNGHSAKVIEVYDQDSSRHIAVEYNFGMCNDNVVEKITIEDISVPIPGKKPDYQGSILGSGYMFGESLGDWKIFGISWYKNDYNSLDYTDTFEVGESYTVYIDLVALDGYTFAVDNYNTPQTSATVNGKPAIVETLFQNNDTKHRIKYTFDWTPVTVTELFITGLDEPVAGATPDFDVELQNDLLYNATVTWCEYYYEGCTGSQLTPEDTFQPDVKYQAEIKIVPNKDAHNVDVCNFNLSEVSTKLNGISPSEVYRSSKSVYIYHVFRKAPQAPSLGANVSGTVTSYLDDSGEVTIGLYKNGEDTPTYSTVVNGNSVEYSIENVVNGIYTLKVSKASHVTRAYVITVDGQNVVQDVKIHLRGDIDGNGSINAKDKKLIYNHMNDKTKELTGYEYQVADVYVDGNINAKDKKLIYNHMNGNSLW